MTLDPIVAVNSLTIERGFVLCPQLFKEMVQPRGSKRCDPNKLNSRNVSLCMNQWIDPAHIGSKCVKLGCRESALGRNWDQTMVENETNEKRGLVKDSIGHHTGSLNNKCNNNHATTNYGNGVNIYDGTRLPFRQVAFSPQQASAWNKGLFSWNSDANRAPLPIGGPFWSEERSLQVEENLKCTFSLVQDYPQFIQNDYKPLPDREKRWTHKVGGTLFTGEGMQVCTASHMHDPDWARSPRRRCQSLQGPRNGMSQAMQNLFNLNLRQPIGRMISQHSMGYLQNKSSLIEGKGLQHIFPPKSALQFPSAIHWQSMHRVPSFKYAPILSIMEDGVQGNKNGNSQNLMSQLKVDVASVRALT